MSLHDVLLSLLREPMSGTDLSRLFAGTIGHFWTADSSQIYRALDALERDECVRSRNVPSPKGPARRVYNLTGRGRDRLAEWIERAPAVPRPKFEYLAQLFSVTAGDRPAERARRLLRSMREDAARSVAVLEAIDAYGRKMPGFPHALPAPLFYPWLTLRHGLLRRRAFLQWIDESLEWLDHRPADLDAETESEEMDQLFRQVLQMGNATWTTGKGETDA